MWGHLMKNFHNAKISCDAHSVFLKLARLDEGVEVIAIEALLELSREGVPLGFELYEASMLGNSILPAIAIALETAAVPFSLNDEVDILTVNMNAIDEDALRQGPGIVRFAFTKKGELASIIATVSTIS